MTATSVPAEPTELAPGLWRWATRHPEWHPVAPADAGDPGDGSTPPGAGDFGAEVACFALLDGDRLLLIDPLLPEIELPALDAPPADLTSPLDPVGGAGIMPGAPVLATLDGLAAGREVLILITLGYHTRSAESLHRRYGAEVWGPAEADRRLDDRELLRVYSPEDRPPGGIEAHAVGRPPRGERILWLPSHAAVVFGDIVVTTPAGELRLWEQEPLDEARAAWYRECFVPTFADVLAHPIERVLVTHGAPVLEDGGTALRAALAAEPWSFAG